MTISENKCLDAKLAMASGRKCDKYDYLIAVFSGLSAGMIDAFFVGEPMSGSLGRAVDRQADQFVMKATQIFWSMDTRPNKPKYCPEAIHSCISYMEQAFPVSYDARYAADLNAGDGVLSGMTASNHHLRSLSHATDIFGLIFSVIDQFSGTASFIDRGKIIRVVPKQDKLSKSVPYLQGTDLISKLFCGVVNWIGHLISDLAGSGATRRPGKTGRGMGVPVPFYEMFLLCDFGDFDGDSFADIAVKVFEQGYDLRHGAAMAIPVVLSDLLVRILWFIRRKFFDRLSWKECIPTNQHSDLRWMLIISNGALCIVDGLDAAIRSGGNLIKFILRLNLIAWFKLALMILKEIMIQYGFTYADLKLVLQRINTALEEALEQLRAIDFTAYEKELSGIRSLNILLADSSLDTTPIYEQLAALNVELQFHNSEEFDRCMLDDDFVLKI